MRISWNRMGIVAALVVVIVAAQPTGATRRMDIYKCPGHCEANRICGETNEIPKMCGPSKDGPWYESTYSCCCCTEESNKNWFQGG